MRNARKVPGVKKIFLGSGFRYDLMLENPELLEEIAVYHSGRFLRVAPEHTQPNVLKLMRKPPAERLEQFLALFSRINRTLNRPITISPYFIIGHPGETWQDVLQMVDYCKKLKLETSDVQLFTPTPGTISTAMYYGEIATDFSPIPVEKNIKNLEKRKKLLTDG